HLQFGRPCRHRAGPPESGQDGRGANEPSAGRDGSGSDRSASGQRSEMSRWDRSVTETVEDATRFWAEASRQTLEDMMARRWAWEAWLRVAAGVIVSPGRVFEPGCGVGLLADSLPPGCTYYGCDVNAAYVEEARRTRRAAPGVDFSVRDFQDVIVSGETFDWVVVTSLFGMFPEAASYELIPRFWSLATRGLSVTT